MNDLWKIIGFVKIIKEEKLMKKSSVRNIFAKSTKEKKNTYGRFFLA